MTVLATSPLGKLRGRILPTILGLGIATPPSVTQKQTALLAAELACQTPEQRAWLARVFMRCGIENRGSVLAPHDDPPQEALRAFYPTPTGPDERGPTTATRLARYVAEAPALAYAAASAALDDAHTLPAEITHLITVSCTGFFAPGLDASLIRQLQLSPSVQRLHVGFMGCHAAFNALAAARDAVRACPEARVLVCCVELCSLHFSYGWDPGKLVANALFADGAAAVVLGGAARDSSTDSTGSPASAPDRWRLLDTSSFLISDSLDAMTWNIGDHGFEMTLAPSVPELVGRHLRPWCAAWLAKHNLKIADIAHWAVHPGGPKVLAAVAASLELPADALRHSRAILARHGNMSSATVLFILQHMAGQPLDGPCVAIGLGPGLMAEGMLLER